MVPLNSRPILSFMLTPGTPKGVLKALAILAAIYATLVVFIYLRQRSLIYFPTHDTNTSGLSLWSDGAHTIGFCREVPAPRTIWLMMHGNAGQAANREYVLRRMSGKDSLYVLEYPGYGSREGSPSLESINRAASEAYRLLRARHPNVPVGVLGESIGSGPACSLAGEKIAPDKIVLMVPFDAMANVAVGHFPFLPVRLMLRDTWDNVEALRQFTGPVEIFGATEDTIIPMGHARSLAEKTRNARFIEISGGHNDWSENTQVKIER